MSRYRAGKVVARKFKRLKEWKAHELGISNVLSIPRSEIVFSAGLDCKASIWDPVRGTKIGDLLQGVAHKLEISWRRVFQHIEPKI